MININLEKLRNFLNEEYTNFKNSSQNAEVESLVEYYDGIADGMKNVMEFIDNNLDYLKK